jgi:hypothetical protein
VRGLKKNVPFGQGLLLLVGALVGGWAPPAHAEEPRVLVLEPSGAPKGFLVALQIQLSGLATPTRHIVKPLPSAAESIDRASQLVRDARALAAVWVDRGGRGHRRASGGPVIVYVVGERQGRALIEVVRVPGDRGPELDRTVALKVHELVAAMQRGQAARAEAAQLLQTEQPPPTAAPVPAVARVEEAPTTTSPQPSAALPAEQPEQSEEDWSPAAPIWTAFGFAGVRLGSQPDLGLSRWGLGFGAGPVLALHTVRLAIALGFEAFPSVTVERDRQRADFWEWTASAMLLAQVQAGSLWLGARAGPQVVGLSAHGTTRENTPGEASATEWALGLGLDAEVPLTRFVSLLAGLQVQALVHRLVFTVNDARLVDSGFVRARVGLDLAVRF